MANDLGGGESTAPDIGPVQGVVDAFLAEVHTVELSLKELVMQLTVEKLALQGRALLLEVELALKAQALQNAETRIGQLQAQLASKTCQCKPDPTDVRAQHNRPESNAEAISFKNGGR